MSKCPQKILELVERFNDNLTAYKQGKYNETQVRREFIDPMFKELGWDIDNEQGYAEAYKEVIHEDSIKIGAATRAPDYCFQVGGRRKFFLEAKKPAVNIKQDISPAFQLRRYAWSAKLPLSILTDFEELAIYDCRIRPVKNDKASTGRVMYLRYHEYPEKWDEIASVFSKTAVLKGHFDKFVESAKRKKGTAEVDAAFLKEIESWREKLARNIALRNGLNQRELNYAVQTTIDRIIFLRICEDRGIESYGKLLGTINGADVYPRLLQLFYRADERYNSGLFHFSMEKERGDTRDELTPTLVIDDRLLNDIIKSLYYPDSPYEFSVLPSNILGQVYEQFLGKVIRLTKGNRAVVEDKPEVKKAGGVYYTPTYIVDYIVKNSVGKLLEGKTPRQASKMRIVDPACGSGSFLLQAYQYLLDCRLAYYVTDGTAKHKKKLYKGPRGDWRLTIQERKEILLNNIYGVDIDPQAVETTKLSLLLKVLEQESDQTLHTNFRLFHERALPDLANNIKCGNSLIGPDFYKGQLSILDEEDRYRINVFDWSAEFSEIMKAGGFDAVIGNPPYVRQETLGRFKDYFQKYFETFHGMADLYVYFIERGMSLLKPNGIFSYIVANKWMRAKYGEPLRVWMKQRAVEEIVDFGDLPVFQKATTYPCVLRISKNSAGRSFKAVQVKSLKFENLDEYVAGRRYAVDRKKLDDTGWSLADRDTQALMWKLRGTGVPLGEYVKGNIYRGVLTGLNAAFVIDSETKKKLISEDPKSGELIKPFLAGRDIKRYQIFNSGNFLLFTRRGVDIRKYPAIHKHLLKFKKNLMPKPKGWKGEKWGGRKPGKYQWYEIQDAIDYYDEFEKPKILLPDISTRGNFAYDEKDRFYCVNTAYIIPSNDKYLLGVLNSRLTTFYYRNISSTIRGGFLRFIYQYLITIPIQKTNPAVQNRLVKLVDSMLSLNRKLGDAKTAHDRNIIQRQINAADREIDDLVYKLYGLTEKEIKIVEESTK